MNLHDLISAFEADFASLFARLRADIAAHSSPAAPQAQFGPPPPAAPSAPVEVAPVAEPAPVAPVTQSTDATAPGFVAPAEPAPAPVEPPAPAALPLEPTMTWSYFQQINTAAIAGPGQWTIIECPAKVRVLTVQRSSYPCEPYTLTVNGISKSIENVQNSGTVDTEGPTVVVKIDQPAGSNLSMQLQG